jgi:hypothetical protein
LNNGESIRIENIQIRKGAATRSIGESTQIRRTAATQSVRKGFEFEVALFKVFEGAPFLPSS